MKALKEEFGRITSSTEFNTMNLLNGDFAAAKGKKLQVGANNGTAQEIAIEINATAMSTTLPTDGENFTHSVATAMLDTLDTDIEELSETRSDLGALQNRLEYTIKNDDNAAENLQNAESRIRDVDMADEMTRFSKESILQQAATSMLAQANQSTQGVLSLLQ